jgi:hypothetical protein
LWALINPNLPTEKENGSAPFCQKTVPLRLHHFCFNKYGCQAIFHSFVRYTFKYKHTPVMKKMFSVMLLAVSLLTACNNPKSDEPQKKGSSGKTLELMIVADKDVYRGETKELIDSLFARPQIGLPVPEKMFDIVNIPVSSYKNTEMFRNHRNIIYCDVNPNNPDKVYMHIDEYAAPQVVFDFAVKDQASLRDMLRKYEHHILDQIYRAEHRRVIKAFKGMENFKVNEAIRQQFGFGLMFSNEFAIAKQRDDFAWVRKEAKDFGIGVLIDVFAY